MLDMPYKEKVIVQVHFKIGEVALMIGKPTSAVRFYHDECPWTEPKRRSKKGHRIYVETDIKKIIEVNELRNYGVDFKGIREAHERGFIKEYISFLVKMYSEHNK